jgi:FdhE protein
MTTASHKIACLEEAVRKSPEYAGIVPLFIELFQYVDLAGSETGITLKIAEERQKGNCENGFPLLATDGLSVDTTECTVFLKGVLYILSRAGSDGGQELEKLGSALDRGILPLKDIFRSIMERNRAVLDAAATAIEVPSPLLEYVFEIPFKTALESFSSGIAAERCEDWQEGYCPVCGARAGMAELSGEEGKRFLSCSACSFRWAFKRLQCPFCSNVDVDTLSYFMAGDGPTRVDTCTACSRYIKTRDSRKGNGEVPLDVEDLLTMHLDLLASREGFERGK